MSKQIVVAMFAQSDAQMVINELTQSGFDTDEISLIMKNTRELLEPESNNEDYDSELEDGDEAPGLISPLDSINDVDQFVNIEGIGEVIVGGPISQTIDQNDTNILLDDILGDLGIPTEKFIAYEALIKNGQALIAIQKSENEDEVLALLADNGSDNIETYSIK